MIRRQDLEAAIAECVGERDPNASTCIKLAAYYTIMRELFPDSVDDKLAPPSYSYASPVTAHIDSDSAFAQAVEGLPLDILWGILDELVTAVMVSQPALYRALMRKIDDSRA